MLAWEACRQLREGVRRPSAGEASARGEVEGGQKGKGRLAHGDGDPCRGVHGQGMPPSFQPFFLPNESFSVVTRLNTGLSAVWSKRSAT